MYQPHQALIVDEKPFPYVFNKKEADFVEQVLKIQSSQTIWKYMAYNSSDWKRDLGQHLYRRYVKIFIDLIIIWKATFVRCIMFHAQGTCKSEIPCLRDLQRSIPMKLEDLSTEIRFPILPNHPQLPGIMLQEIP